MDILRPGWFSYLLTGMTALILSWILTGCRLGNNVDSSVSGDGDTYTGFYEMAPQNLKFCASFSSGDESTVCENTTTNLIPSLVSYALTNPVAFQVYDLDTGEAYLFDPYSGQSALPTYLNTETKELEYLGYTAAETVWEDTECTTQLFIEESGRLNQEATTPTVPFDYEIYGRVELDIQVINTFDGSCDDTMQDLEDCYNDSESCGGESEEENDELKQIVQDLFEPYISAEVITADDISRILSLSYQVSYQ